MDDGTDDVRYAVHVEVLNGSVLLVLVFGIVKERGEMIRTGTVTGSGASAFVNMDVDGEEAGTDSLLRGPVLERQAAAISSATEIRVLAFSGGLKGEALTTDGAVMAANGINSMAVGVRPATATSRTTFR